MGKNISGGHIFFMPENAEIDTQHPHAKAGFDQIRSDLAF